MIYLDYAANTPVNEEVLKTFCEVSSKYIANPNSPYDIGLQAKNRLDESTKRIAELLNVKTDEIIYTSGASESNNLAIKGAAQHYKKFGKHIITTYLEHSSVSGPVQYLQSQGFEIDFVGVMPNGLVDLDNLKSLLRDDTILVSICYVDSEIGIKQDIDKIANLIKEYPHCLFHVDATQAVGKIPVNFENADLVTFAPHKFYGINGCGVLIKKEKVMLEPQIHGGVSTTIYRSGTPALALVVSAEKALSLAYSELEQRLAYVGELNKILREKLSSYPKIRINSKEQSVPFILNISIIGAKAEAFQKELAENEIYVATKSACCAPNTISRPVYALTKDRKLALSTLRISLSHRTTKEEIEQFLSCFDDCYNKLCR